jgi:transcriptional regulator with PAS, ATPase and Fis domain
MKYAVHRLPVLILGESGTGKDLIARALHREGHGPDTPFEAFQVSPVGEELFESNLFGVRKGAFTGSESRKGLIEQARGGVLFLDEIGTLSPGNQISLLRVLEERAMRPLGSDQIVKTDFRLISATNEILPSLVDSGQFRSDLFHRISTLIINVPPLRERKEDILLLAEFFLADERVKKILTKHAVLKLSSHDWPGNVRELLNTIKRAIVESGTRHTIEARDIIIF